MSRLIWLSFRLSLQGLDPNFDYEITEPLPNNVTQAQGTLMIIETTAPVYQLGVPSAVLSGSILMTAGLPSKSKYFRIHCAHYSF
jgi:hypothetical protein